MQSLHSHMGGVMGTGAASRQPMHDEKRMEEEARSRPADYWGEQPTPDGKMMLAAWHRSAAKHLQRTAQQSTPPADEDYDMDVYTSATSPHRFDMEYDMDPYTSSSSPALFDSSPYGAGMPQGSAAGAFADLGLTGNETDEIYCQMLLQLNRENCHLKMQLRQANSRVRQLSTAMEQLRREHLEAQQTAAAERSKPHLPEPSKSEDWFAANRVQAAAGWHMAGMPFPGSLGGAGSEGAGPGPGKHGEAELAQAMSHAQSMSAAPSSMPSPSGSMLSSAGTRSDLGDGERKASSVPPAGAAGGSGGGGGGGGGGGEEKKKDGAKSGAKRPQHWTEEEHKRFLEAMKIFGYSSAQDIARYVGTRSVTQVRTHTQKHFLKLCKGAPSLPA